MQYITLKTEGKPDREAPFLQFILDDLRQIFVVGTQHDDAIDITGKREELSAQAMGKLSEQESDFRAKTINSMDEEGWDWDGFPDPAIIILSVDPTKVASMSRFNFNMIIDEISELYEGSKDIIMNTTSTNVVKLCENLRRLRDIACIQARENYMIDESEQAAAIEESKS